MSYFLIFGQKQILLSPTSAKSSLLCEQRDCNFEWILKFITISLKSYFSVGQGKVGQFLASI
jgi:hypothetical protein